MFGREKLQISIVVLVVALLMAACGGGEDSGSTEAPGDDVPSEPQTLEELVAAAQEEGQLTIQLSGGQEPAAIYAEEFAQKYGINVFVASYGGNENWEKFQTAMEAGRAPADITYQTTVNRIREAADNGWLEEFVPSADAQYPDTFKDSGQWYSPFLNAMAFAWSEIALTPEENEMWINATNEEIWDLAVDPRWKDRIVTSPPHGGGSNESWWYFLMDAEADRFGEPYMARLRDLDPAIIPAGRTALERMTAGEWAVFHSGGGVTESVLSSFYAADSPLRWRYPEPTPVAVWGMGIAKNADHPNAAKLWMEWATSVEGQEALSVAYLVSPANPEAADTRAAANEPWFTPAETLWTDWIDVDWLNDPDQIEERLYRPWEEFFDWTP